VRHQGRWRRLIHRDLPAPLSRFQQHFHTLLVLWLESSKSLNAVAMVHCATFCMMTAERGEAAYGTAREAADELFPTSTTVARDVPEATNIM
jgi:hypothetical protein